MQHLKHRTFTEVCSTHSLASKSLLLFCCVQRLACRALNMYISRQKQKPAVVYVRGCWNTVQFLTVLIEKHNLWLQTELQCISRYILYMDCFGSVCATLHFLPIENYGESVYIIPCEMAIKWSYYMPLAWWRKPRENQYTVPSFKLSIWLKSTKLVRTRECFQTTEYKENLIFFLLFILYTVNSAIFFSKLRP